MPAQRDAEQQFPVRIRIAVPPQRPGRQIDIMHVWLDHICGAEGWAAAPAGLTEIVNDAIAFLLLGCRVRPCLCSAFLLWLPDRDDRRLRAPSRGDPNASGGPAAPDTVTGVRRYCLQDVGSARHARQKQDWLRQIGPLYFDAEAES
jgi:hypothetical protein